MRTSSVLLLLVLFAGSAYANPMVAPAAGIYTYINSEKLTVCISPTGAAFRATFTFARKTEGAPPLEAKAYPATVQLPIWIPVESGSGSTIDNFWRVIRQVPGNALATNAVARQMFATAVGLKILIGEHPDLASNVGLFNALPGMAGISEPGFSCLLVTFSVGAESLRNTLTVSYRQPLLRAKGEGHFYYLPLFEGLPREISTADPRRYAITISAAGGMLKLNTGGSESRVEDGQSVTFSPKARQPIRARLMPGYSTAAPWLKVPNGNPTLQTR